MAVLKIAKREKVGTREARRLRRDNFVPAIVYGHGRENQAVSLSARDIELAVRHGEHLLKCELDGKEQNFLIKDVQYDYMGHTIIHVDLTRVDLDERVDVIVPIVLRGVPVGVESEDGVLRQQLSELNVQCVVTNIPEELRVSVTEMHTGDVLRVADLELPEGVTTTEDDEAVVASVSVVVEEVEAVTKEVEAEPEVIGEKAEEESAEGKQAEGEQT
ncbi:MAG: 50S ribosomal protein L25 [Planctomycetota bacterium]|nr:50S ribosomal protein L25 [Planctomycetota bacterium]